MMNERYKTLAHNNSVELKAMKDKVSYLENLLSSEK